MYINRKLKILIFFILINSFNYKLFSQEPQASAKVNKSTALIGDQITLTLQFKSVEKLHVIFPTLPDSIGKIEIISRAKPDTLGTNGYRLLTQRLTITSFDSGYYEIPAQTFTYEKKGFSEPFPVSTNPVYVKFATVAVDTTAEIKDIKKPMDLPLTFWDFFPWILVFAGVIGLAFLLNYFLKKRKKKLYGDLSYDPSIPAHVAALEALKTLENEKLWQKSLYKQYFIRLTGIIRLYIERRFEIPALEMISEDIIVALKKLNLENNLFNDINLLLQTADLVKFAKYQPLSDECSNGMSISYDFVYKTIQVVESIEVKEES